MKDSAFTVRHSQLDTTCRVRLEVAKEFLYSQEDQVQLVKEAILADLYGGYAKLILELECIVVKIAEEAHYARARAVLDRLIDFHKQNLTVEPG